MMSKAWTLLGKKMEALGLSEGSLHPVEYLVNSDHSAKPYSSLLTDSLSYPMDIREREMIVRALTEKGLTTPIPQLFSFFSVEFSEENEFLWAVGNAIYTIAPSGYMQETLSICRDRKYGTSRQMLVLHSSRYKKQEEAFDMLVSLLDDSTVRGHCLQALWRYGDTRALTYIERIPVKKGLYEAKAKATCLKRLRRKLAEQNEGY